MTITPQHTPVVGPWNDKEIIAKYFGCSFQQDKDGYYQWCAKPPMGDSVYGGFEDKTSAILDFFKQYKNFTETNAHLIAAAPDLLEALELVLSVCDRKTLIFDKAHAAIAKARGQS